MDAIPSAPLSEPALLAALPRAGVLPDAYRDAHGDLKALNWDGTQALRHFLQYGLSEARIMPMALNAQGLVDLARLPLADRAFRGNLVTALARHLFPEADHPYGPIFQARWSTVQALSDAGARPFFIAGDSHSGHYLLANAIGDRWPLAMHLLCGGGSATGLANPASRSGFGTSLRQAFATIDALPGSRDMPLLIQFGQVDLEFVYHFQRVRDRRLVLSMEDYRRFTGQVAERYFDYLCQVFPPAKRRRIFVSSVFPPVLTDAAWRRGYVNDVIARLESYDTLETIQDTLRVMEIADLSQRTGIHRRYNDLPRDGCDRHGFRFVDAMTPFLGRDGVVDPYYRVPEERRIEHHLDTGKTPDIMTRLAWDCIDRFDREPR
jgi:hypothetical protein